MLQDLRFALRMLRKHPVFSAVAVLTLALGVGANAALFSVTDTLFLRSPRGVAAPERLVVLGRSSSTSRWSGFGHLAFRRYQGAARSFSGLVAARGATALLHIGGETLPLSAVLVTGDYFGVLGVRMARGRGFRPEEDSVPGAAPVVILSDATWRSRFGSDATAVGRTVRLNDTEFTIIGVAPPGFRGLDVDEQRDVWIPLMMEAQIRPLFPVLNSDFVSSLRVVGRLAPGVSLPQAQAELDVLAARFERPQGPKGEVSRVVASPHIGFPDPAWRADAVAYLAPLWGAAVLVLLVVCTNLAGLLLARAASRRREVAVRLAIGAGRGRLVRQLLGESLVLAVPGTLGALVVARAVTALVRVRVANDMDFGVDGRVLAFTAAVAAVACAAFGLVPALQAVRGDPAGDLRGDATGGPGRARLRFALVATQVGASLMLCVGAGLLVRTLRKAAAVDVGFETRHLLIASPGLEVAGYDEARAAQFYPRLAETLAQVPGVRSVAWASAAPVDPGFLHDARQIAIGGGAPSDAPRVAADYNEVSAGYFATLGQGAVHGRTFTAADDSAAPLVAVVNEAMARRHFAGQDPIGRELRLVLFMDYSPLISIVGVVPDVRTTSLDAVVRPEVFVPRAQYAARRQHLQRDAVVLVRADREAPVAAAVRSILRQLDPDLPPVRVTSLADRMAERLSDRRLYAELIGLFGALALLLAAVGLYGVLAFEVARRTREIGIRMALGARPAMVLRMVMRRGLAAAGTGLALGLAGGAMLTRVLRAMLYGVTPGDPVTFVAAALVIVGATLVASWLPARRAMRVDPVIALRAE